MERKYCPYCMSPIRAGQPCPNCGLAEEAYVPAAHHLPPGTVLDGRYVVGRVLGEGGFGITYIGCDLRLELRVAIKEYYPTDRVSRFSDRSFSVQSHTGSTGRDFEAGRERFLQEARVMARMNKTPQIVGVRDFFQENNTAYIVMEYVDGTTLKELVTLKGGKISASELLPMVEPLFSALSAMHALDLIHRDISPDNLMLGKGGVRLLDFGCARESAQGKNTMTVVLKHGYSPIEQYQHKGQGPWTDVYSLAATLYYCLTGKTPPQSLDRICDEELIPPRRLGADLTPAQERAILRGMGIRRSQRYGTVEEFRAALYQGAEIPPKPEPVMRGDLTVALEPELIPAIPELEPVMAEPQPGPVMRGDLTIALEPEPEPAPVEPEQFAPRPVYPPPRPPEGRTDHPIEEQSRQEAQRRQSKAWMGIVAGAVAAVLLLALLIWRPWAGEPQAADEPPAATESPLGYDDAVRNILELTSRSEIMEALDELPEEELFSDAVHVTTEKEFLQHRKGDRPIVIDADISVSGAHTVPVLVSPEVTVSCGDTGWCVDGTALVNRGTLVGTVATREKAGSVIVNYGTISDGNFYQRSDSDAVINAGIISIKSRDGELTIQGGLVNLKDLKAVARSSEVEIYGHLRNCGTFYGAASNNVIIMAEGRLFNEEGTLDLRGKITVCDGAKVNGVPEERIRRIQ